MDGRERVSFCPLQRWKVGVTDSDTSGALAAIADVYPKPARQDGQDLFSLDQQTRRPRSSDDADSGGERGPTSSRTDGEVTQSLLQMSYDARGRRPQTLVLRRDKIA